MSFDAQVAQSVEQRTENPRVGGSIPSLATIYEKQKSGEPHTTRRFFVFSNGVVCKTSEIQLSDDDTILE